MTKLLKILKYLLLVSAGSIVLFYGGLFVLFMLIGIKILLTLDPLITIPLSQKQKKQDMISVDLIPGWMKQI